MLICMINFLGNSALKAEGWYEDWNDIVNFKLNYENIVIKIRKES